MRSILAPLALTLLLAAWACGGDVVVDDAPSGSGGAGASTGASPSTGANSPSGSGAQPTTTGPQPVGTGPAPACGCDQACAVVDSCLGPGNPCDEICPQLEASTRDCLCNATRCDIDRCFVSTGSGGSGGGPNSCLSCVTGLDEGTCAFASESCQKSAECMELVYCHIDCQFTAPCIYECDDEHPIAIGPAYDLLQCAVCESCFGACQNGPTDNYCLLEQ